MMLFEHSIYGSTMQEEENLMTDEDGYNRKSKENYLNTFSIRSEYEQEQNLDESTGYREKRIQHAADVEELIKALGSLNLERDYWLQTATRVKSLDPIERYEGTKQFRMMLSVSGEIPIQAVIDTGVVPKLVDFISESHDTALQFEAAWALTNIASGTGAQTEVRWLLRVIVTRTNGKRLYTQLNLYMIR